MLQKIGKRLRALHRDERGADMVEYILIIAAVALPVLGIILWFRTEIGTWISEAWDEIRGGGGEQDPGDL